MCVFRRDLPESSDKGAPVWVPQVQVSRMRLCLLWRVIWCREIKSRSALDRVSGAAGISRKLSVGYFQLKVCTGVPSDLVKYFLICVQGLWWISMQRFVTKTKTQQVRWMDGSDFLILREFDWRKVGGWGIEEFDLVCRLHNFSVLLWLCFVFWYLITGSAILKIDTNSK